MAILRSSTENFWKTARKLRDKIRRKDEKNMTAKEKLRDVERLLRGCPDIMTPAQVARWSPYGRNTVYKLLHSGELKSYIFRGGYLIAKTDLIEHLVEHSEDTDAGRSFRIKQNGDKSDE